MATFRVEKPVSVLPSPLKPNTIYFVRVGAGFDMYVSDSTGAVTYSPNPAGGASELTLTSTSGATQDVDFDATDVHHIDADVAAVTVTFSGSDAVAECQVILDNTFVEAWGISGSKYTGKAGPVSTEELNPYSVHFSSDGTKMYVLGLTTDTVYQYTLSTAWDVSTASYASKSFSVTTEENAPYALAFNATGTKMYVAGNRETIYQYTLSTAWDVSTASYDAVSFSFAAQMAATTYIEFSADGTKLYAGKASDGVVYQYTLSAAWHVGTASYASKSFDLTAAEGLWTHDIAFSSDGTKMFTTNTTIDEITEYTLSTAWDISTASDSGFSFSPVAQAPSGAGLFLKADGLTFYLVCVATRNVYQYDMSAAPAVSLPSSIELDEPLSTLGVGTKTALRFMTYDSGTSYQLVSKLEGMS